MNSADLENVKRFQESFKKEFKDFKHIEIQSDPEIESGGANDAVTTAKILDANVTTSKIADANITTAKILDDNITTAKQYSIMVPRFHHGRVSC